MIYCSEKRWYALRIRSRWAQKIETALQSKQLTSFNPTYQVLSKRKDRKKILRKPIFSGYFFVQAELDVELHLEILKTYGVIDLLKDHQRPLPIPDDQIEKVRLLEQHVERSVQIPDFCAGDTVKIIAGPLTGLTGVVDRVNRRCLRIYLQSIPSSVNIELDPLYVKPLHKKTLYSLVTGSKD